MAESPVPPNGVESHLLAKSTANEIGDKAHCEARHVSPLARTDRPTRPHEFALGPLQQRSSMLRPELQFINQNI